jgi:4-hydroxy-tetrahydrodipicolinate synthase
MNGAARHRLRGVLSPVLTPFGPDGKPSTTRFVRHCRWLLDQGVGLAAFGTNSEANSLSTAEKMSLLDVLLDAGLPADRMMPGTGACALPDAIAMTRHAVDAGCAGVLMLPPFYYKGVSDEGLFRSFASVIDAVADRRLRVYLYNVPPMTQVPLSLGLIERLLKAYPDAIAGVKDSSGDWTHTHAMLREFQPEGFDVFAGSRRSCCRPCGRAALAASPPRATSIRQPSSGCIANGSSLMHPCSKRRWTPRARCSRGIPSSLR